MIIGKRRLKQIKLVLVSPTLEKITQEFQIFELTYESYGLGQSTLNLRKIRSYFNISQWEESVTIMDAFDYLGQVYIPRYYSKYFRSNHIPLQNIIVAQQRTAKLLCNSTFTDCEYGTVEYTQQIFAPENETYCWESNCSEFQLRNNVFGSGIAIGLDGNYQTYYEFKYYTNLKINQNSTKFFGDLLANNWIDNNTLSVAIFGSVFDLDSQQQVQVTLLMEQQFAKHPLYLSAQFFQLPFFDISDSIHVLLFSYLIFIGLLKIFRTMLELTYIFSRFNFIFQLYNFSALIVYCIVHFQILIVRYQGKDYNLLFSNQVLQESFAGKILSVGTALQVNDSQTTEDVGKVLLLLGYPFSFLQFLLIFNAEWMQNYFTLSMRTLPGLITCSFLSAAFYFISFFPQRLLDIQYRTTHHSINYIAYLFAQMFLSEYQEDEDDPKVLSMIIDVFHYVFQGLIGLYFIGLSIEGFRKASIYEMPYQTRYEKEFMQNFDTLDIKINKVLKQVQKLFIKEKQSKDKKIIRKEDDKQSQILDDDELLSDFQDINPDKILIVFEINNTFLEEINRYKARRDANQYAQKRIKYSRSMKDQQQSQKVGIIQQLLQKDKVNSRLQVMLSKYQANEVQYNQLPEEQAEQINDFFQIFQDQITDQGVKIRNFFIIDQVIKFLEMLLRLRPEFLSLNAEQRIRIMFYINSDQVEEEDVYKLLSFLIVNLAKQHLNYPILVFSCHKEWYIEKAQYLKLKKFYRNIFSTLEKECALEFCLMKTSFFDFQLAFSKDQQFYEKEVQQEEISNSMIEEGEDKSELL